MVLDLKTSWTRHLVLLALESGVVVRLLPRLAPATAPACLFPLPSMPVVGIIVVVDKVVDVIIL
jgi:hypothetical protein